jgi:hypothetical protein
MRRKWASIHQLKLVADKAPAEARRRTFTDNRPANESGDELKQLESLSIAGERAFA